MGFRLSNLPPGVTDQMIEKQAHACECFEIMIGATPNGDIHGRLTCVECDSEYEVCFGCASPDVHVCEHRIGGERLCECPACVDDEPSLN